VDGRSDRGSAPLKNIGPVTITTPGDRQIVVTRIFRCAARSCFRGLDQGRTRRTLVGPERCAARGLRNRSAAERSLSLGEPRS
jgi:hypothetical protein